MSEQNTVQATTEAVSTPTENLLYPNQVPEKSVEVPAQDVEKKPDASATPPENEDKKDLPASSEKTPDEKEKPKDDKSDADDGKAVVDFELVLPEDSSLTAEQVEATKAFALEKKLNPEQAQMLLERESAAVTHFQKVQTEALETKKVEWIKAAETDVEIGGEKFLENVRYSKSALDQFRSAKLKEELNRTGLGNHPELLRAFVRIGLANKPDSYERGGNSIPRSEKSIEEKMYPNMFNNK